MANEQPSHPENDRPEDRSHEGKQIRRRTDEEEMEACLREIEETGGCRLEDFIHEIEARIIAGAEARRKR